jgi:hypothetical protein
MAVGENNTKTTYARLIESFKETMRVPVDITGLKICTSRYM